MTREETVSLTQYIKALCPQQAIDRFTPLAWHDVIGHLEFAECKNAAIAVSARQPFVAPAEIIAEIAADRGAGLEHSRDCRSRDCRNCRVTWCMCVCHPAAVMKIAGPPSVRQAIESREERQLEAPVRRTGFHEN